MNQTLETIYSRSSVRSYLPDDVPEDDIKEIIKAGFHAANGLNTQALEFVVVQDPERISRYSDLAKDIYNHDCVIRGSSNPILDKIAENKDFNIFYGAPVVIFVFASSEAVTPVEDGSLAIGNMMLAARSMDYGTCWIGMAAGLGYYSTFREENNVPEASGYIGCIALGRPKEVEEHPRGEPKIISWTK